MSMSDVPGADVNEPLDRPEGEGAATETLDLAEEGAATTYTPELELGDQEVRLPWLESDDDDDEAYRGYDTGQLVGLFMLGLLAVMLIGGGLWWFLGHRKDDVLVADGSVIAAPQQPYKEQPKDPGGKTFAGTGDTSFAVSEGKTRSAKLGEPAVKPLPTAKASGDAATAAADAVTGVGVQIAAYSNRSQAEAGWTKLSGQYEALSGLHHRVVEGQADIGTVYRLQAVPGDAAAAHALCGKLKGAGLACQVKN